MIEYKSINYWENQISGDLKTSFSHLHNWAEHVDGQTVFFALDNPHERVELQTARTKLATVSNSLPSLCRLWRLKRPNALPCVDISIRNQNVHDNTSNLRFPVGGWANGSFMKP